MNSDMADREKIRKFAAFLDNQESMQEFLKNVYCIIDPVIENYLERKFTDLMISFGCTGGQHRSVYSTEKTFGHINLKYQIS